MHPGVVLHSWIGYREAVRQLGSLILLPILSGLLLVLSFPRIDLGLLAWVALVPLLVAIRNQPWKTAMAQGFLTGIVFYAGALSWVVNAMHLYGQMPVALSYLVMLLLAAYCALYLAIFTGFLRWASSGTPSLFLWGAPALWVALELARTHLFSGFPWALLGYSQYDHHPVIQVADFTGVYGVSFLIVLVNVLIAVLIKTALAHVSIVESRVPVPWVRVMLALMVVAGSLAYGHWRLVPDPGVARNPALRIGIVQPNVDQSRKWDTAFRRQTIDRFEVLTTLAAKNSDFVLWPEAATPFLFEAEAEYREELLGFVREQGVSLLFGSPATIVEKESDQLRLLNSAFLISADGQILDRYDKIHLVPFGEYIPFKHVLKFLDKLVVGIGDFFPGNAPEVMQGPGGRFGVVICFEVIFPDLVRRFVDLGADYMITITNDAWFGRSSAPYQHFGMVVFRAVENRVYFARAANTGISGFIDPFGRIVRQSNIFTEEALTGEIRTGGPRTFYTAYGDLFGYVCVILALFSPVLAGRSPNPLDAVRARYNFGRDHAR